MLPKSSDAHTDARMLPCSALTGLPAERCWADIAGPTAQLQPEVEPQLGQAKQEPERCMTSPQT